MRTGDYFGNYQCELMVCGAVGPDELIETRSEDKEEVQRWRPGVI